MIGVAYCKSVSFYVVFKHNIESRFVAHIEEFRCGRVMRSTDCVYVEFFHLFEIVQYLIARHAPAVCGVSVVMVNAFKLYRYAVYKQFCLVGHSYCSETEVYIYYLAVFFKL